MRKSNLEKLREARRKKQATQAMDLEGLMKLMLAGHLPEEERIINPTQREFIYDPTRLKAYMGAAGVAKTSTLVCGGLLRALLQPGSKGFIGRHDYNDLMDTTARRAEEMLQALPKGVLVDRDKSPPMKWYIQPVIPDGDISEITFMGLKDAIGSYEFNWALIDEADECDEKRVLEVNTRLRHRGGNYMLALAFNPPPTTHWLYTACTGKDSQGRKAKDPLFKLYLPKKGENDQNLPPGYHDILRSQLPEDMVMRLVEGQWGAVFPGQPVYRQFKYDIHSTFGLPYEPYSTLYRFWDFGYRHPVCLWAQLDFEGRLLILREHKRENVEVRPFAAEVQALTKRWFPDQEEDIIDFGDPAARQKKDTGSTLVHLSQEGITLRYRTSTIEEGLRIGRQMFEQLIDGKPAIQFDRSYCSYIIDAFRGGYRMDDKGEKPFKDGFYDHGADAFRYGLINLFGAGKPLNVNSLPDNIAFS